MPYQDSYYLPEKISRVAQGHHNHYQNPGLILDKYVPRIVIDDTKQKGLWLRYICTEYATDKELVQAIYRRWQALLTAQKATQFDAPLEWRMVVGLGGESVLETDITLHHLYGIPFIPGSALKGLTRAFASAQKEYAVPADKPEAERKPSLEEKTDHPDIQRIFGTQDRAGTVLFFDAFPANGQYTFAIDIMNPHYPDYYSSLQSGAIKVPANNQSPNPITFLTIQDAVFTFALAVRDPKDQEDLQIARTLLQQAIEQYGVGGKTSAGYGYFKKLSPTIVEMGDPSTQNDENAIPPAPAVDPDLKKAEGFKLEIERLKQQDIAGQIPNYYQKWQKLVSQEARIIVAQAIIEKVRKTGREKASASKSWYQGLQAFLTETK